MRFLFTFFFIIFMFQSVSFSQEWRIKNKWKISCGLVNKEALVINGKPKKTYSKNEFKVDSAIFKLNKGDIGNVNLIRNQQGGTNTLADRRLHINFYLAKISLRQRFLHQEHLSIDLIFFKYMMVDQKGNLLPWFQLIKIG